MNKYRVDINNNTRIVPCGMTSILYIGDNWESARGVLAQATTGVDSWGNPNSLYGVTLSVWSDDKRDYIIKATRDIK
jgi:hypothetical protein